MEKPSRRRTCTDWSPERLVYWYFRINGFLFLENFMLHPDSGSSTVSDVDLVAVRFLHRRELFPPHEMEDDPELFDPEAWVTAHLVEIKRGLARLNPAWKSRDAVERALRAIGLVPEENVSEVAEELREKGYARRERVFLQITVVGDRPAEDLPYRFISFDHIIGFLYERFRRYRLQKSNLSSWSHEGRFLRDAAVQEPTLDTYCARIREAFDLRSKGNLFSTG